MNWKAGLLVMAVSVLGPVIAGCGGHDSSTLIIPPVQTFPPESRANVLSLGNSTIPVGAVTPIEVRLVNPSNVAGVQGRILYDATVVEVVDPTTLADADPFAGSVLPGGSTVNYELNRAPVNGQKGVTFAIGNPTGVNTSGRLLRLWFRPRTGVPVSSATVLKLDPAFPFLMAGPQGQVLTSNTSDGSLIVTQ